MRVFTTRQCRSVYFRCYDKNIISAALLAWNSVVLSWTKGLPAAKTGWKPNRKLAQGSALGNSEQSNLRSERAKGKNEYFTGSFCAYSALDSRYTCTQGVTLGCIPFGASPRLCCNHGCCTLHYSNIVPLLLVTSAAMQCFGVILLWKLRSVLAYNINCYITPWTYHHAKSCGNFAPSLSVATVAAHCPYSNIVPLLLVTIPATAIHDIFFCLWDVLFAATGFTKKFIRR